MQTDPPTAAPSISRPHDAAQTCLQAEAASQTEPTGSHSASKRHASTACSASQASFQDDKAAEVAQLRQQLSDVQAALTSQQEVRDLEMKFQVAARILHAIVLLQ